MGGRLNGAIFSAAIAVCAIGAAPAAASTLIGPPIVASNNAPTNCSAVPCGLMDTIIGPGTATLTAPSDGVLTAWHVVAQSPGAGTAQLRVVRPTFLASAPNTWAIDLVASGTTITPGPSFQEESAQTRTPIAAGEMLAVVANQASIGGYTNGAGRGGFFTPAPDGSSVAFNNATLGNYYLVDADLEPDADHDGYGDETQDQCPTNPSTQGSCPTPATSPTGQRAAALKKCKHKHGKARKRCKRRANRLPV